MCKTKRKDERKAGRKSGESWKEIERNSEIKTGKKWQRKLCGKCERNV